MWLPKNEKLFCSMPKRLMQATVKGEVKIDARIPNKQDSESGSPIASLYPADSGWQIYPADSGWQMSTSLYLIQDQIYNFLCWHKYKFYGM